MRELDSLRAIRLLKDSPAPLYHQLASVLRQKIALGELTAGMALPSLREAAERWGVNLHTVRRAYQELAKADLVRTRHRSGTVVAPGDGNSGSGDAAAFLRATLQSAWERFGWSAETLAGELARLAVRPSERPSVWVLECSASLAAALAEQIRAKWHVDARPWDLARLDDVPEGPVVGTFFHYNQIRLALAARLPDVQFVTVRLDQPTLQRFETAARASGRAIFCGSELVSAHSIAADVEHALVRKLQLEIRFTDSPIEVLRDVAPNPVLFSPRSWDRLGSEARQHPQAFQLQVGIEERSMEELGVTFGWRSNLSQAREAVVDEDGVVR